MSGRAGKKPATPRGLAGPKAEKTVALALQGGGAHGAFTWGVLDQLLEDGRLAIEAVTGASAGAMNAVVLLEGWSRDGPEGAREQLRKFWKRVSLDGVLSPIQRTLFDQFLGFWSAGGTPAHLWLNAWSQAASPYELNPLDINPLRDLVDRAIDFDAIERHPKLKVFVSATHVRTGKAVIFTGRRLDTRAVLASACLPMLFRAVEIDGEPYWDGGYSVNPALAPLIHGCDSADVMLVQINPLCRQEMPRRPAEIVDRVNELNFNASLLTQMRAIEFLNRLVQEGSLSPARCKLVRVHRIDGGAELQSYPSSSRTSADGTLIQALFELGQAAARQWLERHRAALGRHGTVDIREDYLDDTLIGLPPLRPHPRTDAPWWRPWLGSLLRRRRA